MATDTCDKQAIKAIPTTYNRIAFRSRLEARWALAFDLLSISYEYEPEKYYTGVSRYIPDFRLAGFGAGGQDLLLEVKGKEPSLAELERANSVGAFVVSGALADYRLVYPTHGDGATLKESPAFFHQCPLCGKLGVSLRNSRSITPSNDTDCHRLDRIAECFDVPVSFRQLEPLDDLPFEVIPQSPMLILAFEYAHSAKFEDTHFYELTGAFKKTISRLDEMQVSAGADLFYVIYLQALWLKQRLKLHYVRRSDDLDAIGLSHFDIQYDGVVWK